MNLIQLVRATNIVDEGSVTIPSSSSAVVSITDKAEYSSAEFTLTFVDTVTLDVKTKRVRSNWTSSTSVEQVYAVGGSMAELTSGAVTITNYEITVSNLGPNPITVTTVKYL